MRIGIDATALPPEPVGAGTYMIQLIRALTALEAEYELVIFAQSSGRALIGTLPYDHLAWITVSDKNPALRLIWEQTVLPVLASRAGLDLLHSLHYTRPYRLGCSSVVTFHDMTYFLYPELHTLLRKLFFTQAIRSSARHADAIIAVSETTRRDTIRQLGVPAEKIFTAPNGVDPAFQPITDAHRLEGCRGKYNLPRDFILYLGTIEPRKNIPLLLRAYHRLAQTGSPYHLVITGKRGWMYKQVWETIEDLNLQPLIHFPGYIPVEELPIVYNLARVFVYPTIYEGFGLPPLEAMACGTPVITTAVPAMQELLGDAGILVPPQEEDALFQALRELLIDRQMQAHLSMKGRERARHFTWKSCAQTTMQVYQHVGLNR
jgi:glycosyltransferase involved in cell wall biosynthesis